MHRCVVCGYCYFDENGDPTQEILPGTQFENLPDNWHCPVCNVTKDYFVEVEEPL